MDAPKGLILFSNTPLGKEFDESTRNLNILLGAVNLVLIVAAVFLEINLLLIAVLVVFLNAILIRSLISASAAVPLAVNLNHPFMESEPVSKSEIMVKFSENWVDPGNHRLKLAKTLFPAGLFIAKMMICRSCPCGIQI